MHRKLIFSEILILDNKQGYKSVVGFYNRFKVILRKKKVMQLYYVGHSLVLLT